MCIAGKKQQKTFCILTGNRTYPAFDGLLHNILSRIVSLEKVAMAFFNNQKIPKLREPFQHLFMEVWACLNLVETCRRHGVKVILIYQGYLPLTCMIMKLQRKKLFLFVGGSRSKASFYDSVSYLSRLMAFSQMIMESICWKLSDRIIILSESMIKSVGLQSYSEKVLIAPSYPRDLEEKFYVKEQYGNRRMVVGYIGAFRKCKGIQLLVDAIPQILGEMRDLTFLLIGDGNERKIVERRIKRLGIQSRVRMLGKIPHEKLSSYYNQLRLLVIPSFTEGLPATMLEAMACGTPVLATGVGGILDYIHDKETGFLLESNHPSAIAKSVIELVKNEGLLERVSRNSVLFIKEKFSEEIISNAWKEIINDMKCRT